MKEFFRYLRGYLKIKVWGYSPERFMNLCSNHHILLWDIARQEDCYTMYISLSDFYKLRPIVKKTGTRAAVLERYGLPFFIRKMRKRKVFALGLPCCLAFLIAMSQFVWAIDFEGNVSITDDVLLDFLAENGVDYGVAKNKVDIEALEAGLRENFDIITWTSARIEGTHFIVKIKENDLAVEEETEDDKENWPGSNLVATQDGVVVSILTRQGVPKVTEGTSVQKGDILVSGAVPVMADDGTVREYQFCHADADVALVYEITVHEEQPLLYEYKNYTNREKKDLFFSLGHKRYILKLGECRFVKYDTILDSRQLCILNQIYLPFYYGFVVHREYLPVEAVYQEKKAESMLNEALSKNIVSLEEKGVQIIQKDVKIEAVGNMLVMDGYMTVQGNDGKSQPVQEQQPAAENETEPGSSQ